ncbi:thioredoxin domain-containing protein [Candidatus Dojkabacteria bacterium]|nr:thioredoxin domain-containing protein [Candidatus Dojkabacteria bacterium]
MQSLKDNAALLITLAITLLIGVIGLALLTSSSEEPISEEEKSSLLEREDSHTTGNQESEIVMVEFSDFECSACAYYHNEFNNFKQSYNNRVKFVYRHFPLESIHPLAFKAAEASEAAASQDKFWEYQDLLFKRQSIWSLLSEERATETFIEYAEELEVEDLERFEKDLKEGTYTSKVQRDLDDAEALKLGGTPTVFINGEQISNPTYENLSIEVDKLL